MKIRSKIVSLILAVAMMAALLPAGIGVVSAVGDASKFLAPIEPITDYTGWVAISDRAGLEAMAGNLSGKYYLTNDIDLSGAEWTPIGTSSSLPFTGVFDGQGYVIKNLKITGEYRCAGLFGYASGATIKNVGLEGTNINISSSSTVYAGGICGYNNTNNSSNLTISNCYNKGVVSASNSSAAFAPTAGGICGIIVGGRNSSITISNCYNTGDVSASNSVNVVQGGTAMAGGVCGNIGGDGKPTIGNCYNTGDVSASSSSNAQAGGICSKSSNLTISNCHNTGDVSASGSFNVQAGGICGQYISGTISNCYNTGYVFASSSSYYTFNFAAAGGICGGNDTGTVNFTISNCYNTGDVSASSGSTPAYAGGICGSSGGAGGSVTISNCYNTSDVSASGSSTVTYAGGICGYSVSRITTISNSYWNSDSAQKVNGSAQTSKKGVGYGTDNGTDTTTQRTSADMKKQASFGGFDFGTVWEIDEGKDYPQLRPYTPPPPTTPPGKEPEDPPVSGNITVNMSGIDRSGLRYGDIKFRLFGASPSPYTTEFDKDKDKGNVKFEVIEDKDKNRRFAYSIDGGNTFTIVTHEQVFDGGKCRDIIVVEIDEKNNAIAYRMYEFVPGINYAHPDPDQWTWFQDHGYGNICDIPEPSDFSEPLLTTKFNSLLLHGKALKVSQGFLLQYPPTTNEGAIHPGIDFAIDRYNEEGESNEIYAPISGEIIITNDKYNTIAIYNEVHDITVVLLHSDRVATVKPDNGIERELQNKDIVKKGQLIAYVGKKGTDAYHVHIEVEDGKVASHYYTSITDATETAMTQKRQRCYDPRILVYIDEVDGEDEDIDEDESLKGHVLGNDTIGIGDAQLAFRAALKLVTLVGDQLYAADLNDNDTVEISEAMRIFRYALKLSTEL